MRISKMTTEGCHAKKLEQPDQLVIDFDPDVAVPWSETVRAAQDMRERLSTLGLESFVKLLASQVAEITAGTLHGPDVTVDGAAIDSRALRPGTLSGTRTVSPLKLAEAIIGDEASDFSSPREIIGQELQPLSTLLPSVRYAGC